MGDRKKNIWNKHLEPKFLTFKDGQIQSKLLKFQNGRHWRSVLQRMGWGSYLCNQRHDACNALGEVTISLLLNKLINERGFDEALASLASPKTEPFGRHLKLLVHVGPSLLFKKPFSFARNRSSEKQSRFCRCLASSFSIWRALKWFDVFRQVKTGSDWLEVGWWVGSSWNLIREAVKVSKITGQFDTCELC